MLSSKRDPVECNSNSFSRHDRPHAAETNEKASGLSASVITADPTEARSLVEEITLSSVSALPSGLVVSNQPIPSDYVFATRTPPAKKAVGAKRAGAKAVCLEP